MSQKYVIVHFIDIGNLPTEFVARDWPLHITFLANFALPDIDAFQSELRELTTQTKPFTAVAEGEALFGPKQNVNVNLVKPDAPITELHNQLLSLAQKHGAKFDELKFAGDGYRPHATKQKTAQLTNGQLININHLTLVDMYPDNDISRRRIITSYSLKV